MSGELNEQRDGLLLIARALGMTSEDQGRIANVATPEEMAAEIKRIRDEVDELRAAVLRVHHAEQDLKRWQQIEYDDATQRFCDEIEWYAAAGRAQSELMKLAERLAGGEGGAS